MRSDEHAKDSHNVENKRTFIHERNSNGTAEHRDVRLAEISDGPRRSFAQIDRVTQARGEVEKASAHMLLSIRKEMTDEQVARLDDHGPTE